MSHLPSRIVCLTEETTDILYRLGAGDLVVGVSGYTVHPPEARKKPKVSAFTTAKIEKILDLKPDLVLAFSDLQADIVRDLIREGVQVLALNQRSVPEILDVVSLLGRLVDRQKEAAGLRESLERQIQETRAVGNRLSRRPKVFFEEWPDPLISGIRWVSELIEIAGGEDCFPELREKALAKDRILDPSAVIARKPDLILASWCGKKVRAEQIKSRLGWTAIPAVAQGRIVEIKSALILQPGPVALTEGLAALHEAISAVGSQ